jgi:hypothetical protein
LDVTFEAVEAHPKSRGSFRPRKREAQRLSCFRGGREERLIHKLKT